MGTTSGPCINSTDRDSSQSSCLDEEGQQCSIRVQTHSLFYNASASQHTAELGGNVVDANSSDCPQGIRQCADVSCNPVRWRRVVGRATPWVQALLRG